MSEEDDERFDLARAADTLRRLKFYPDLEDPAMRDVRIVAEVFAHVRRETQEECARLHEEADTIKQLEYERDVLIRALKAKADELAAALTCRGCEAQHVGALFCPLCVELDRPGWVEYEIDTDDVGTLEGFDGVIVTTGEINASAGIRMTRETARTLADRLDALLRKLERQRRESPSAQKGKER